MKFHLLSIERVLFNEGSQLVSWEDFFFSNSVLVTGKSKLSCSFPVPAWLHGNSQCVFPPHLPRRRLMNNGPRWIWIIRSPNEKLVRKLGITCTPVQSLHSVATPITEQNSEAKCGFNVIFSSMLRCDQGTWLKCRIAELLKCEGFACKVSLLSLVDCQKQHRGKQIVG